MSETDRHTISENKPLGTLEEERFPIKFKRERQRVSTQQRGLARCWLRCAQVPYQCPISNNGNWWEPETKVDCSLVRKWHGFACVQFRSQTELSLTSPLTESSCSESWLAGL